MVEDEADEADFLRAGFDEARLPVRVEVIKDPQSCLARLRGDAPLAELVLLDIDRPDLNSMRLIHQLKENVDLSHIPVIAMTSDDDPDRLKETYRAYVSACIRKPMDLEEYRSLAEAIYTFWFNWGLYCRRGS